MSPKYIRSERGPAAAKYRSFELKGVWLRLAEAGSDKKRQVLILRQLCYITAWLGIIGICAVISTCQLVMM